MNAGQEPAVSSTSDKSERACDSGSAVERLLVRHTPSPEESAFLARWDAILSSAKWGVFLTAWARSLTSTGTTLAYVDQFSMTPATMTLTYDQGGAANFSQAVIVTSPSTQRRAAMATQAPTDLQQPLESYRGTMDAACALCQTVGRVQDHLSDSQSPRALLDLGHSFLVPNRYPMAPGHSLLVSASHDPARFSLGRTPSYQELRDMMAVADGLDLVAMRNHAHDGMSIPSHDHFHLFPSDLQIFPLLTKLAEESGAFSWGLRARLTRETPFQHLALTAPTPELLAEAACEVLSVLDPHKELYVLGYYKRSLLVSYRQDGASLRHKLRVGGASLMHSMVVSPDGVCETDMVGLNADVPRLPSYEASGTLTFAPRSMPTPSPSSYSPIRYDKLLPVGEGSNLRSVLTPEEWRIWSILLPSQDKRDDPGHAEIVTIFSHVLAAMEGADPQTCRTARIAAMVHDTGWARVPDIGPRFAELTRLEVSGKDPERRRALNGELRLAHQVASAEIAEEILPRFCTDQERETIVAIVRDHDTREFPPVGLAGKLLWDADMLARVTVPSFVATAVRIGGVTDVTRLVALFRDPSHYVTKSAQTIAPIEYENALAYLNGKHPYGDIRTLESAPRGLSWATTWGEQ